MRQAGKRENSATGPAFLKGTKKRVLGRQASVYVALFGLLFFCVTYMHQGKFDSPTPVSRLDLLHALLVHGTVKIDAYDDNTPDKALSKGSYYSDKAPGTVALALLPFTAAAGVLRLAGVSLDSEFGWLFSSWVACAGSIGIITALGAVALFVWLSEHVSSRWALVTTLALFLGAAPLPYATMMFSHALVAGLIAIAIWAIGKQQAPGARNAESGSETRSLYGTCAAGSAREWAGSNWPSLVAGFACGWALASEYSSGLVVAALFFWLVSKGWRRTIPFCLAAVPPLLLIPAYSWACFGNPFTLPYSHQASFPAMKEGLYAIKWPDAETAFNLLFSPARGLFFWTPFFVMGGFGYWELMRRSRALFWLTCVAPLLQILVISGRVWDWPGGPAWGPRLLSPMIPLLALPCAYGLQRFPVLGLPLAVYSILATTLATLTDACPSMDSNVNPLIDLNIPLLLKGEFSPNLGMALRLPPYVSLGLFYAILIGGTWWLWRSLFAGRRRQVVDS